MKRETVRKILLILVITVLSMSYVPATVSADTFGGYSVQAVIPENQVDKKKTYFDLRMEPSGKQTIQIVVSNGSKKPITAKVSVHNATTGRNGLILYTPSDNKDVSLKTPITDITKVVTPEVTIPPSSKKNVDIEINMPKEKFDGCLLGGIYITADEVGTDGSVNTSQAVQIENNYAHTIGLKITENDTNVSPELHLRAITPGLINYRPMVTVNLQNSRAAIIKGMNIKAQVYKKGSDTVLKTMEMTSVDMAPNSNFDAGIDWEDKALEAGSYRLKMKAQHAEKIWEWDEEFTIDAKGADDVNSNSAYPERKAIGLYILIGVLAAIIVILLFMFIAKKRKDDEENESRLK